MAWIACSFASLFCSEKGEKQYVWSLVFHPLALIFQLETKYDFTWPVLYGSGFQDVSCIKDLTSLYEAATIEDIYHAYEQLKVDEDSLYSCVGVAGTQAGEEINGKQP